MKFICRDFDDIYLHEKLKIINPHGSIGIVTLWSKSENILQKLRKIEAQLDPSSSDIAVIGNLYGLNGIKYLLANLLFNPQITTLIICGHALSDSGEALKNYFASGIEKECAQGTVRYRIINTASYLYDEIHPALFNGTPRLIDLGSFHSAESFTKARLFFKEFTKINPTRDDRIEITLKKTEIGTKPSNLRSHTIVSTTPIDAWEKLIFRIVNFGVEQSLKKGKRRLLQNVKVIVECPSIEKEHLQSHGFDIKHFKKYQKQILNPTLMPDIEYSYGNRIRSYFHVDALALCIEKLKEDRQCRKALISLWDTEKDLDSKGIPPCLCSLFFHFIEDTLTLTACFRTHNAYNAWLENFYGLMAILNFVGEKTGLSTGAITVFSHSISIAPEAMPAALLIANQRKFSISMDPQGYFEIYVDHKCGEIVACHKSSDIPIKTYRSGSATVLQHHIACDMALSDINHAIYVGRQLARAEYCLKNNMAFTQE
ncbi:MAG: thymidylate synthase [bacterium]